LITKTGAFRLARRGLANRLPIDIREERHNLPLVIREEAVAKPTSNEQVLQGTLDLLILKALSLAPMHGWGVAQRIQQISRAVLQVNQGSLYPALRRLEDRGWIAAKWGTSENNRRARYYRLTSTGRAQLQQETESWERFMLAVQRVLRAQPV